uniref:DM domain-containing protein n=1 Tax=Bursaphelenchus xylophilus TaxID=6326 RepID=A0A1I7RMS0_BURXY
MNMFNPVSALSTLNVNQLASKISGVNKRVYYCQRCLNHGRLEPRKNHKCECAFINCQCNKCILVEKRRVLNTQLHELEDTAASAALVKLEEIPEQEDDLQADEMRLKGAPNRQNNTSIMSVMVLMPSSNFLFHCCNLQGPPQLI